MSRECPQCGNPLSAPFRSCACGWQIVQQKKDACPFKFGIKVGDEWVDRQCAFNDHGYRCEFEGWMSHATNGHGPWYCSPHFFSTSKLSNHITTAGQAGMQRVKEVLNAPQREPGCDDEELAA